MATIVTDLHCDLTQNVKPQFLHGNLFSQDNAANTINVHVFNNGEPAALGGSISANVIRSDGATVAVSGAIDGNKAYIILPQACYAVPGVINIIVKNTENATVTTIAAVVANVYASSTDTVVDPGTIIPSVAALIAEIEAAVDSIPVDYSGLLATIAEDYSSSKTYPIVGMYAWQGGVLKRNIVPITTAETYTAAHWTNAVIGDDLSALKSAIDLNKNSTENSFEQVTGNRAMVFVKGYYRVYSDNTVVDISAPETSNEASQREVTCLCPCSPGDKFTIKAYGRATTAGAYGFLDSDCKGIARGGTSQLYTGTVTAPANAAWFICNNDIINNPTNYYVYKGESLKDRFENNVLNEGMTVTGLPAVVEGAAAGKATATTSATQLLRYKKNLMTLSGSPSSSFISRDENGAFVINGTPSSDQYINIQTKINLKAGVEYRVDGSPRNTVSSTGLCIYNSSDERKGYDQSGSGATYTPSADETVRLRLRLMAGTYSNVKFYPVLCENATAQRFAPPALELLEGYNEVIGFDFAPLTIGYDQSKIALLNDKVEELTEETERYSEIFSAIKSHANEDGEYDSDFTETIRLDNTPVVLTIKGQYTGDTPPTLRILNKSSTGGYSFKSARYTVGGTEEPTRRSWRIPMKSADYENANIEFVIPEGTVLNISEAEIKPDQRNRYNEFGIRFHGHRGAIAPVDTVEAFQLGAELGYTSMIAIPKFTTDEIGVCFHDDNTISGDLCWMDGTSITGSDDKSVTAYSYEELLDFRVKSTRWGLLHIATLDDYFRVCSLTGMNPIFSLHSSAFGPSSWGSVSTKAHWVTGFQKIRSLAVKWNVLDKIGIKAGSDTVMKAALEVFGNDIDCYIWLSGQSHDPYNIFSLSKSVGFVDSDATDLTGCEYTLKSEYFYTQTVEGASHYSATMTQIADLLSKGYIISVAETDAISGEEMRRLIGVGVTEFTVDSHISMGLYW